MITGNFILLVYTLKKFHWDKFEKFLEIEHQHSICRNYSPDAHLPKIYEDVDQEKEH